MCLCDALVQCSKASKLEFTSFVYLLPTFWVSKPRRFSQTSQSLKRYFFALNALFENHPDIILVLFRLITTQLNAGLDLWRELAQKPPPPHTKSKQVQREASLSCALLANHFPKHKPTSNFSFLSVSPGLLGTCVLSFAKATASRPGH